MTIDRINEIQALLIKKQRELVRFREMTTGFNEFVLEVAARGRSSLAVEIFDLEQELKALQNSTKRPRTSTDARLAVIECVVKENPEFTKRQVFEACKNIDKQLFSIEFKSFSTGGHSPWSEARKRGLVKRPMPNCPSGIG